METEVLFSATQMAKQLDLRASNADSLGCPGGICCVRLSATLSVCPAKFA